MQILLFLLFLLFTNILHTFFVNNYIDAMQMDVNLNNVINNKTEFFFQITKT